MEKRSAARSAQYGQACMACFKIKCRCVPREDGHGCERCHRLKKPCQAADELRRRPERKQSSDDRIAKLEDTLGQLVSMLQANNVPMNAVSNSLPVEAVYNDTHTITPTQNAESAPRNVPSPAVVTTKASWPPSAVAETSPQPISNLSLLDSFRERKLHHCPFIHIPPGSSTEQLQQDRPFVHSAIVCVMASSTADKRAKAIDLKRRLSREITLQQPQRQKLDLLIGVLIYIAWGWEHLLNGGNTSHLMMIATSLASDMCLDRAAKPTNSLFDPAAFQNWQPADRSDARFLLERQRAVLGCFIVGSAVSTYFSQMDLPRWSPILEDCLSGVTSSSANPESRSDGTLYFQAQLQFLALKAFETCDRAHLPQETSGALPESSLRYIKSLMVQLQSLRGVIPPEFQHTVFPLVHTYYAELRIIEAVHTQEIAHSPPTNGPKRLWYFWQSALAIKSCTSTFLTLSPAEILGISIVQWSQLAGCIATLRNLCALGELGWDLSAVRRLVDLPSLVASTAEKLDLAAREAGEGSDGAFAQLARGMAAFDAGESGMMVEMEGGGSDMFGEEEYSTNPTLWMDRFLFDAPEAV